MRTMYKVLIPDLLAVCLASVCSQARVGISPLQKTVILSDDQGTYPLGLHLEILEDSGGKSTIDEVALPARIPVA